MIINVFILLTGEMIEFLNGHLVQNMGKLWLVEMIEEIERIIESWSRKSAEFIISDLFTAYKKCSMILEFTSICFLMMLDIFFDVF
jgi:hypothetical protein